MTAASESASPSPFDGIALRPADPACPPEMRRFPVLVTLPILWGDQDAFGHVNNTASIRWFESSRIAYFERPEIKPVLANVGVNVILASVQCHYRRQLAYPDTIHVGARVVRLGRSSLAMEHVVYSVANAAVASEGECVVVVFDYTANRSVPASPELRAAIAQLEGQAATPLDHQGRKDGTSI